MEKFDKYILGKEFEIEYRAFGAEMTMRPHSHNLYEMCFFEDGKRNVVIDDKMYSAEQNDVMLMKPNIIHGNVSGEKYARTVIYFTDKFLYKYYTPASTEMLTKCFENNIVTLTQGQFAAAKRIFAAIFKEAEKTDYGYAFAHLAQLSLILEKAQTQREKHPVTNTLTEIMSYVRGNFTEIQGLEEIASEFHITKEYLCRLFKRNMQCTVTEYINSFKIQKACGMLIDTNKSITDIGFDCGFNSTMYFCRVFKKNMEMSPNTYRKLGQYSAKITK